MGFESPICHLECLIDTKQALRLEFVPKRTSWQENSDLGFEIYSHIPSWLQSSLREVVIIGNNDTAIVIVEVVRQVVPLRWIDNTARRMCRRCLLQLLDEVFGQLEDYG